MAGPHFTWTIEAGEDLNDLTRGTGHIYKAVALDDGKLAQNGREAGGILLYGAKKDEHVTLGYAGVIEFVAAEDIRAGSRLTVTKDGYMAEATQGTYVVGRCVENPVEKDQIGIGVFNFATVCYMHEKEEGKG